MHAFSVRLGAFVATVSVLLGVTALTAAVPAAAATAPINGGGSGFAALEMDQWRADTASAPYNLSVNYVSQGSSFGRQSFSGNNVDFGVSPESPQPDVYQDGESFGLSVFLRDGDSVFRTYFTTQRGVEALGSVWTFLDLTPLGRQEEWEDSPEGYPQTKPYSWWRRHDEYEDS